MRATVLTIAGSDSSGGAGVQADLKAIAACGGYGASVLTAITAQNTRGVRSLEVVSPAMVLAQLQAVLDDLDVLAVKTGMLATAGVVEVVADELSRRPIPALVCDPVLAAKSGDRLLADSALPALRHSLLPLATLVTPNVAEAEALTGRRIRTADDAEAAARDLLALGCAAVLVKGGHLGGPRSVDVLVTRRGTERFEAERLDARHTHGTGCTLASAIATHLALGRPLPEAVARAKGFVTGAIRHGLAIGRGIGPTDPFWRLEVGRLHVLTDTVLQARFGHAALARLAAEGGADVVQVRDKGNRATAALVGDVREALAAVAPLGTRLIVDDRADIAAATGADGVHLGRHDLTPEAARSLLGPGALIGGTANSLAEARAVAASPVDYVGVGPVFGTTSKADPAPELGLAALQAIAGSLEKPVIAIGGVTPDRVPSVLAAGAHGVAVVSAVDLAADPREAARALRRAIEACCREGIHA